MDNDGWLDLFVANGHVYPEVSTVKTEAPYAEHKYLYRNLQNGRFEDVSAKGGPGITAAVPARGCAFGDYDNDGDVDVVVNCVNSLPQLLRCDAHTGRHWVKVKVVGTKSNRTGIGARVRVVARTHPDKPEPLVMIDEVRSGGSYFRRAICACISDSIRQRSWTCSKSAGLRARSIRSGICRRIGCTSWKREQKNRRRTYCLP